MATTWKDDPQKVDIVNAMGLQHSEYQNNLYSFALANPSAYAKMRTEVIKKVKIDGIKSFHTRFYNLLKYGTLEAYGLGGPREERLIRCGSTFLKPMYPEQELNEFCLGACEGLEKLIDDALSKILAVNAEAILRSKYAQSGAMISEPPATAT